MMKSIDPSSPGCREKEEFDTAWAWLYSIRIFLLKQRTLLAESKAYKADWEHNLTTSLALTRPPNPTDVCALERCLHRWHWLSHRRLSVQLGTPGAEVGAGFLFSPKQYRHHPMRQQRKTTRDESSMEGKSSRPGSLGVLLRYLAR